MPVLNLRAHHLLCMQGYQGYGYSENFQTNMSRVIQLITADPDIKTTLSASNDMICACCPYDGASGCQKGEDSAAAIRAMDLEIISRLKIKEGCNEKVATLLQLVNTTFKTRADIHGICSDCRWQEQCLWFQKLAP
jgi:hypothetical protein